MEKSSDLEGVTQVVLACVGKSQCHSPGGWMGGDIRVRQSEARRICLREELRVCSLSTEARQGTGGKSSPQKGLVERTMPGHTEGGPFALHGQTSLVCGCKDHLLNVHGE